MEETELSLLELKKNDISEEYLIISDIEYLYNTTSDNDDEEDGLSKLLKQFKLFEELYEFLKGNKL